MSLENYHSNFTVLFASITSSKKKNSITAFPISHIIHAFNVDVFFYFIFFSVFIKMRLNIKIIRIKWVKRRDDTEQESKNTILNHANIFFFFLLGVLFVYFNKFIFFSLVSPTTQFLNLIFFFSSLLNLFMLWLAFFIFSTSFKLSLFNLNLF